MIGIAFEVLSAVARRKMFLSPHPYNAPMWIQNARKNIAAGLVSAQDAKRFNEFLRAEQVKHEADMLRTHQVPHAHGDPHARFSTQQIAQLMEMYSIKEASTLNVQRDSGIAVTIRKPAGLVLNILTVPQRATLEKLIMVELQLAGERMVKEARKLVPAPATVPRVTVPSLAGRDFKMINTGGVYKPRRSVFASFNTQGRLTAHLGKGRMNRLNAHGFIDYKSPSAESISSVGGLSAYKARYRPEVKSIIAHHRETMKKGRSTGMLRASIKFNINPASLTLELFASKEYAKYVEFGTGLRGKSNAHPPDSMGHPIKYKNLPGMRAQPFLYPAFVKEMQGLPKKINAIIMAFIRKVEATR